MNPDERTLIRDLFTRLQSVEERSPPRDLAAERYIRERLSEQPGAPYYMAQTILVQEQALRAAEERIRALEDEAERAVAPRGPWGTGTRSGGIGTRGSAFPSAGGGFLAGAAQTAMGVAGGVLLGSLLAEMFEGGEAHAAEPADESGAGEAGADDAGAGDAGAGDSGDFGDFDFGDAF
jgi:hypothetical protein